jgi:EmrB/QacA subfamily drug resistance transporter
MTAVVESGPAAGYRWRWRVLVVVLIAEAMDILDTTTVNVMGPSVRRSIGGGLGLVQWLSAAYTLAFAVLLITGARLGDRYGQRRMFLAGATGFTAASVLCGLAVDPGMLIGLRAVQGAFGAVLLPQGISLLTRSFSGADLGRAFSAYAPVLSLAAVGGPLAAGGLIAWDLLGSGWRLVFFINLVLGLAVVAGARRYLPPDGPAVAERLDARGVALAGAATFLLVYPLIEGRPLGWPWWTFALLGTGLAGLGAFAWHERRAAAPLIEPSLLRRRSFLAGTAVALSFFAASAGIMLVLSLYAQYALRYSALQAGLMLTPVAAGNVTGALAALRLTPRLGGRRVIRLNLAVAIAGLAAVAAVAGRGTPPGGLALAGPIGVLGVGLGGIIAPLFATILAGVAERETGSASGFLGTVQQLAGSIGVAAITAVYAASHRPAGGLAVTAVATAAVLAGGACLTALIPAADRAG